MTIKFGNSSIAAIFVGTTVIEAGYHGDELVYSTAFEIPETLYTNPGGQGNRTSTITVTSSPAPAGGSADNLVDGATGLNSSDSVWWADGNPSGRWIQFDFGVPRYINEATWLQSENPTLGTWQWQRSTDATTWVNIGSTFTLGGTTAGQVHTQLGNNDNQARYYRMLGISGFYDDLPYIQEITFKIDAGV